MIDHQASAVAIAAAVHSVDRAIGLAIEASEVETAVSVVALVASVVPARAHPVVEAHPAWVVAAAAAVASAVVVAAAAEALVVVVAAVAAEAAAAVVVAVEEGAYFLRRPYESSPPTFAFILVVTFFFNHMHGVFYPINPC